MSEATTNSETTAGEPPERRGATEPTEASAPDAARAPQRRGVHALPFMALICLMTFWGIFFVVSFQTVGHRPVHGAMAALTLPGAGRAGLMILGYIVLSAGTLLLAAAVHQDFTPVGSHGLVARTLVTAGTAALGAAVFRVREGALTITDGGLVNFLHYASLAVFYVAVLSAMLMAASALRWDADEVMMRRLTVLLCVIAVPALLATFVLVPDRAYIGLAERLLIASQTAWMGLVALRLS